MFQQVIFLNMQRYIGEGTGFLKDLIGNWHAANARSKSALRLVLLGGVLATGACVPLMDSQTGQNALAVRALDTRDQWEEANRAQFERNKFVNDIAISPAARTYRTIVPQPLRDRIDTGSNNLDEPRIFANNLLQGRFDAAHKTFGRFLVNSILGLGGLFDVASLGGLERQSGDFGQTLFVWGFESGPYWVMPVFGPANVRDGIGRIVDIAGDPIQWILPKWVGEWPLTGVSVAAGLGQVELLDDLQQGSVDPYARFRSTYLQNRAGELAQAAGITIVPELVEAEPAAAPAAKKPRGKSKAKRQR